MYGRIDVSLLEVSVFNCGPPGPSGKYFYVIKFLLGIDLNDFSDGLDLMEISDQHYDIGVIQ